LGSSRAGEHPAICSAVGNTSPYRLEFIDAYLRLHDRAVGWFGPANEKPHRQVPSRTPVCSTSPTPGSIARSGCAYRFAYIIPPPTVDSVIRKNRHAATDLGSQLKLFLPITLQFVNK
jgi:hypothetical protein